TMAALFLRQCGYDGSTPLVDPMCGSGTFVIEAAEMAAGLKPGRSRAFAFEQLKSFDAEIWAGMREVGEMKTPAHMCFGRDLDLGAIRMSHENAARAGVAAYTDFAASDIRDLQPPEGPPGLIIINPPYGTRIGEKRGLNALHAGLGYTLRTRFQGWRVGLVTSDSALAGATDLPFAPPGPPVSHGGLKVRLYQARIR
ncbi:MAG: class I SAM-dependent RNA methyltransferase, partial [Aestuariivirgaceae bacterium]|nr:class I SAM-dependent RNA methyltransferase [Aestuariivirgaceae bacterium]